MDWDFDAAREAKHEDTSLTDRARDVLADGTAPPGTVLAAAKYLDKVVNDDGEWDNDLVIALAPLLEREAGFDDEAQYLGAARMLAEVALRHQRWSLASNALLVLDLRGDLPSWGRAYRVKVHFRMDPDAAFCDPRATIGLLGPLDQLGEQGEAVAREFVAKGRDYFVARPDADANLDRFVQDVRVLLEPSTMALGKAWNDLKAMNSRDDATAAAPDEAKDLSVTREFSPRPIAPPSLQEPVPEDAIDAPAHDEAPLDSTPPDAATPVAASAEADGESPTRMQELEAELAALRRRNEGLSAYASELEGLARDGMLAPGSQDHQTLVEVPQTEGGRPQFDLGRRRILLLGASRVPANKLTGIAKGFGIQPAQLELEMEYDKLTNYDLEKLRHSTNIAGVLIGPVPHSMRSVGTASSAVALLSQGEGFPPSAPLYASGELKVTKTSFKQGLVELADQMLASGASSVGRQAAQPLDA